MGRYHPPGYHYDMTQRSVPALEWRCSKCTARTPVDMTSPRGWRTGDCRIAKCASCGKVGAHVAYEPMSAILKGRE